MPSGQSDQEPLIFALDTSSPYISLAITRGESVMARLGLQSMNAKSERIWAQTNLLFGEAGIDIRDIHLFAVCTGPGGFTGIRVGMAAAKGFASASKKPLAGVPSLDATAMSAYMVSTGAREQFVCSLIRAYRGEIYSQLFKVEKDRYPVALNEPMISHVSAALDRVSGVDNLILAGDAAMEHADEVSARAAEPSAAHGHAIDSKEAENDNRQGLSSDSTASPLLRNWLILPPPRLLAADVARLAYIKYLQNDLPEPAGVRACYIRPSEAEIKLSLGLVGPGFGGSLAPKPADPPADPNVAK